MALSANITGAYLTASPASVNFGSQTDGTTSATQTITLTNQGYGYAADAYSVSATNSAFSTTLDSGCASVAVGATCDLNITFSPTAVQSYSATGSVLVTDVSVRSVNGDFGSAVTLSASGLPAGATATFAPTSITPGGESASSVLTIQTASLVAQTHAAYPGWTWMPAVTMAFCIPLLWWRRRDRMRRLRTGLLCVLLSVGAGMLSGCCGGYYSKSPAQSYTVTVTGTSGSTQHSTTVTLTVQ